MNIEHYREMKTEAKKLLSEGLPYGFASAVIWELANRDIEEIDVKGICDISSLVIETKPDCLTEQEKGKLWKFEGSTEARVALLAADTDKVKSYVFESPRLPEIRGGSLILEGLNTKKFIKTEVLDKYDLPEDCIVYCSGGSILLFTPASLAQEIKQLIEKQYLEETITATITVVTEAFSYSQFCLGLDASAEKPYGFGELVDYMAYRIRRAKQEKKYVPFCETVPFARQCDSCGIRPVSRTVKADDEQIHLCNSCHKKRIEGRDKRGYLLKTIADKLPDIRDIYADCDNPKDLEAISGFSEGKYIGLIYADGNGVGKQMEKLSSCEEYRRFADGMLRATSVDMCRVLAVPDLISEDRIYGIEMLCGLGSDDVMAIVPGKYALQLAVNMCKAFENSMPDLTMSAGVIIAPYDYPVYFLEETCEQLLKSAKSKSRKLERMEGRAKATIDFWAITSQEVMASNLESHREQYMEIKLSDDDRLVLYERPYTLGKLQSLLKWIRKFRRCGFPVNQLYGLREMLDKGRMQASLYYLYQLSRMSKDNRNLIQDFVADWYPGNGALFPWSKREKPAGYTAYSTPIVDLLEIYNLAEGVQTWK